MDKFRVEFNPSGYYSGQGVWETIDEFSCFEADDELDAIELAKQWWFDNSDDHEKSEQEIESYVWRASKIKYDNDGYLESYTWTYN